MAIGYLSRAKGVCSLLFQWPSSNKQQDRHVFGSHGMVHPSTAYNVQALKKLKQLNKVISYCLLYNINRI
jgi:hypothetical protein